MNMLLSVLLLISGLGNLSGIDPIFNLDSFSNPGPISGLGNLSGIDPIFNLDSFSNRGPISGLGNLSGIDPIFNLDSFSNPGPISGLGKNSAILPDANEKSIFMASARLSYPPDSSSHKPVAPPAGKFSSTSTIYVDELDLISDTSGFFVKIEGNLPTPCHNISLPVFERTKDTLSITITSWYRTEGMCAQVLEPFVLYLDITSFLIASSDDDSVPLPAVLVNGHPVTPRITK